jgi:hypothetical protein
MLDWKRLVTHDQKSLRVQKLSATTGVNFNFSLFFVKNIFKILEKNPRELRGPNIKKKGFRRFKAGVIGVGFLVNLPNWLF